jgi:hypothetical protein
MDTPTADAPIKAVEKMLAVGTPLIILDSHDHPHAAGRLEETEELIEKLEKEFQDLCRSWKIKGGSHEHENGSRRR